VSLARTVPASAHAFAGRRLLAPRGDRPYRTF